MQNWTRAAFASVRPREIARTSCPSSSSDCETTNPIVPLAPSTATLAALAFMRRRRPFAGPPGAPAPAGLA